MTMWTKNDIPDQTGRTAIVTGANTGIGFETALALYEAGAHVVLACRNTESAKQAAAAMKEQKEREQKTGNEAGKKPGRGTLETAALDLASLDSVALFARGFAEKHERLDLLINNAGVMIPPASLTADGYELQFGVNFIGHFALTGLLFPLLDGTPGSRIVTVSSLAYLRGMINFDNLRSEQSYDPMREYSQSKLADLLLSLELQRRIVRTGGKTVSVAAQPGANKTELSRHMSEEAFTAAVERVGELMEPWQGALPSLYAAVSPEAVGGALYGPDKDGGYRGYPARAVITPNALDEVVAGKLWDYAEQATGVKYPR